VVLAAPETKLTPVPQLAVGPYSACSDVLIDVTASSGSGGRPWAAAEWFVSAVNLTTTSQQSSLVTAAAALLRSHLMASTALSSLLFSIALEHDVILVDNEHDVAIVG
jgi:hypothetical protein